MKTLLTLIVGVAFAFAAARLVRAEPFPLAEVLPKTKLEQFQVKTGSVVIVGFSQVGVISGSFGSHVSVEVRQSTDASTGSKQTGVLIQIKTERTDRSSYVDADEVVSLIAGIEYIAKLNKAAPLASFQADYRTRGDLEISVFNQSKGEIVAAIKVGRIGGATAFVSLKDLADFRALLERAQTMLSTLK